MDIDCVGRCEEASIPRTANDITAQWLNQVLAPHLGGHRVFGAQAKPFSEPGQTADVVEIWIDYDSARCALPERMIAKLAARDGSTREMCQTFALYEKEVSFYQKFADDTLPMPRCFHAQFDPDTQDMIILMEHLAPSYSPAYGVSLDQVRMALREVTKIHARWWNDDTIKRESAIVQLDDRERWRNLAAAGFAATEAIRDAVGSQAEATIEVINVYQDRLENVVRYWQTRPFTLSHADFHGKQMFFPNTKGEGKFALIDFQYPIAGPGVFDVSRLLNLGLSMEDRKASQSGLIEDYFAALTAHGVEGYSHADFLIDHRLGTMMSQLINAAALFQTDTELLASECAGFGLDWKDVWLLRGEAMLRELNVADFLRAI